MMKRTFLAAFGFLTVFMANGQSNAALLENILAKISSIRTVTYHYTSTASVPHDTLTFNTSSYFYKMQTDTSDHFIAANYYITDIDDYDKVMFAYDGTYAVNFDWKERTFRLDTIGDNPWIRLMPPFFIWTERLISYAIRNEDSMDIRVEEFTDSIQIHFTFQNKIVEFDRTIPSNHLITGKSSYELVVGKDYLPFKVTRKVPFQVSWRHCTNIQLSEDEGQISALACIPDDFKIKGGNNKTPFPKAMEGKPAPEWKLKMIGGDSLALGDIKQKVIMIEFTNLGSMPCLASIPFLKQLQEDFQDKDFKLVSIEVSDNDIKIIESFSNQNQMNYTYLVAKKEVPKDYQISVSPSFLILDENRIVKKMFIGYSKGDRENEIRSAIEELLKAED